ncbi:MAG: type II toxin-antitoxin system VapC family toxin [Flavobacteriales bacterium]|nr:type II toxin-antitoxin system VapC family toxin [Flavobacteriales bacterium]
MSGRRVLLDTSIVLDVLGGLEHVADLIQGCEVYLSVITRVELFASFKPSAERQAATQSFIDDSKLVQFSQEVQDLTIRFRRQYRLKLPDAAIAATAFYLDLELISADKAFSRIKDELPVLIVER